MSRSDTWMPLEGDRLFASDTWLQGSLAARAAMLPLWWAAWKQDPVGSLPDNDASLAQIAGFGRNVKAWLAVRAQATRGFTKGEDNRLHHPVVRALAERSARIKARSERERESDRERLRNWRAKRVSETVGNGDETGIGNADETRTKPVDNKIEQDITKPKPSPTAQGARARGLTLPEWLPAQPWADFVASRAKLRKPLTDGAARLVIAKLDAFRNRGIDVALALNNSTENGWQGVFEPKSVTATRNDGLRKTALGDFLDGEEARWAK